MLLKNMTAMNFEALSLFQHTTVPTPQEQQQSMGELKDIISNTADISCIENRGNTPGTARTISRSMSTAFTSNTNISLRGPDYDRHHNQQQQIEYHDEETPRKSLPIPSAILPTRIPLGDTRGINPIPSRARPPSGSGTGTGMVRGTGQVIGRPPLQSSVNLKDSVRRPST